MKKTTSALLVFLFPAMLLGGYKMGTTKPVKVDPSAPAAARSSAPKTLPRTPDGTLDETPIMEHLSQKYHVGMEQIVYFRKMKYGYEELVPSLIFATEANIEPGQILSLRDKGKTWKEIAKTYSVDLKPLNKKVVEELAPLQKTLPKKILEERPTYIKNDQR